VSNTASSNTEHVCCSIWVFEQFTENKIRSYNDTRGFLAILAEKNESIKSESFAKTPCKMVTQSFAYEKLKVRQQKPISH